MCLKNVVLQIGELSELDIDSVTYAAVKSETKRYITVVSRLSEVKNHYTTI